MESRIDAVLDHLARSRPALLATLATVDDAQFDERPSPAAWSVALVLEHLARVEDSVTRGAQAMLDGRLAPPAPGRVRPVEWALDRSVRVGSPPFAMPAGGIARAELMARLARTRQEFVALLGFARGRDRSGLRMAHPQLGTLALDDMFAFVAYHEQRHHAQVIEVIEILEQRG